MNGPLILSALAAAAKSTPLINWAGLGKVMLLALLTAVIIVGGYSLGLAGLDVYLWSREAQSKANTRPIAVGGSAQARAAVQSPPHVRYASLAVAIFLFALCIGGVVVGLWAMVSK